MYQFHQDPLYEHYLKAVSEKSDTFFCAAEPYCKTVLLSIMSILEEIHLQSVFPLQINLLHQ